MRMLTCEQLSDGHPDKICDQISDAVVTDCLQHDPDSRVAVECLLKDNHLIIAGELTSKHEPDYKALVDQVFDRIGRERLGYPPDMDIQVLVKKQSPDIAMGVDTGGAGDQGVMFGHIGVYIGGGEVIEAMGTRYGVVKTQLAGRGWTHWLKIPGINYD